MNLEYNINNPIWEYLTLEDMKMKKLLALVVALVMTAGVLSSCCCCGCPTGGFDDDYSDDYYDDYYDDYDYYY